MTANPVHIGRIVEHASTWWWFKLDRMADALKPGDLIRVRPNKLEDYPDYPFRTGECKVIGTFGDFVHAAFTDIAAIADMDHVYLAERPSPYAPGEKMTDRHPNSVIAQVVEETLARQVAFLEQPHPTLAAILKSAHATPGKQWFTPVVYEERPAPVVTTCPGYNGVAYLGPARRPDGFDQRQVDAARAALLAPAPPRYPRSR